MTDNAPLQLVLASSSPRRKLLLEEAGFSPRVVPPTIDDGELVPPDASKALDWVAALANLKARNVFDGLTPEQQARSLVLGSDTVVISRDLIIGQPPDEDAARSIITRLSGNRHTVASGVALLGQRHRRVFVDTTCVRVGEIPEEEIESYVASGAWKGKAGGYNYSERLLAGWDLAWEGDTTTIMGLPMLRLKRVLGLEGIRVY